MTAPEDLAAQAAAIDTAVMVLWSFTGRQYGCCPRIIRPCPREREDLGWYAGYTWYPYLDGGIWRNEVCGCGPRCRVDGPGVVHLPGPVCSVTAVTVDGAVLDDDAYVLEGDRLYAVSGRWPRQDLRIPGGQPGTWSVEYLAGQEPPAGADQMVGLLALEFLNACNNGKCRLPRRVESLTRQGVSMKMKDPAILFKERRTGIAEIDSWIVAANPTQQVAPSEVSSPDYPGGA